MESNQNISDFDRFIFNLLSPCSELNQHGRIYVYYGNVDNVYFSYNIELGSMYYNRMVFNHFYLSNFDTLFKEYEGELNLKIATYSKSIELFEKSLLNFFDRWCDNKVKVLFEIPISKNI